MAELQHKLTFQNHKVPAVKLKTLTGKEWDFISWEEDVWEDPDKAGDTEPLISDEFSLPVEEVSQTWVEVDSHLSSGSSNFISGVLGLSSHSAVGLSTSYWKNYLCIAWGNGNGSSQTVAMQDNIYLRTCGHHFSLLLDLLLDSHPSRFLKVRCNVSPMMRCVTLVENYLNFLIYTDRNLGEHGWEWKLRVWNNGERNLNLDRAEFIDHELTTQRLSN